MIVSRTKAELRAALATLPGTKALVMTMGALHEGHLALVAEARRRAEHVIVSIYVNPLQFGPNEDFAAYPRDLAADLALLGDVDLVFAPTDEEMYPREPLVRIDPGPVATVLEGATRPGHFAGVLQVVAKVLIAVGPDYAMFGQKDAQQLALISTMVADLDIPVEIVPVPIVRDADGVARSSRNAYLSPQEREHARALSQALRAGMNRSLSEERSDAPNHGDAPHSGVSTQPAASRNDRGEDAASLTGRHESVLTAARAVLDSAPGVRLDYLVLVDPTTFTELAPGATRGLLAVAAWVGTTRLIDNTIVEF